MSKHRLARWAAPVFAAAAALSLVIGTFTFAAAQSAPVAPASPPTASAFSAATALTVDEEEGLLFMYEEEKLAHDLYVALGEAGSTDGWSVPVFTNIARAEAVHSNAVLRLLTVYNVAVPAAKLPAGEFLNADLQALYDNLVAQGSISLADALAVGALVEETDIADLDTRIATSQHVAIDRVYSQLRGGSTNHLQAFVRLLARSGGADYTPQVLSSGDFAAALAAPRPGRH